MASAKDVSPAALGETGTGYHSGPGKGVSRARSLASLLPLYAVVFVGFVGYSLMITVFTPMLMGNHDLLLAAGWPLSKRIMLLSFLLCLYPLDQFVGSPILGSLSDRFGRKPVLLISLLVTTVCYALIAVALDVRSFALLATTSLLAGCAEANIVAGAKCHRRCGRARRAEPVFRLHLYERQFGLYHRALDRRQAG